LSHDVKKNKLLKKLIALIGYKLIDKDSAKTERSVEKYSTNVEDFLGPLIKKKIIKKVIQVGANDGKSDDFLFKYLSQGLDAILIEPIDNAFKKLEANCKSFNKVRCLNKAVDLTNNIKEIYTVDFNFKNFYQKKYKREDVDWLNILSSFDKNHLIKHGIKKNHIITKKISCVTFQKIIQDFNYNDFDLLIVDTEGYDCTLINNFIDTVDLKPLIIFEWIHAKAPEIIKLLDKLKYKDYHFLKFGRDLICYQNNILFHERS
jgi:FkbM family methyltransferase